MSTLDNSSGKYQGSQAPKHVNTRAKAAMMIALDRHRKYVPESQRYYEKKRSQGKKHNQAIRALGRHLCRIIYKMLKEGRDLFKPGILYILDRAHGLHFFEVRTVPVFSWQDLFSSLIEGTEQMETITHLPFFFLDLLESKRLLGQHLGYVDQIALPFDLAVVAHPPNRCPGIVFNGWNFPWVRTRRDTINTSRSLSSQRFMRALIVILLQEKIKMALLAPMSGLWRDIVLKSSVHPFMTAVLAGLSRLDSLGADAELIHHFDNSLTPPMASQAKGAPLSVRIARAGHTRETPTPTRV